MNRRALLSLIFSFAPVLAAFAQTAIIGPRSPREFPAITNSSAWQARAADIRTQILVDAGLWPPPQKTPLNAKDSSRRFRLWSMKTWLSFPCGMINKSRLLRKM